jgi:hypothetical protein
VDGGCVLRKVDFEVQRVEGLRRTRSLSDGGRIGFWAGLPQAFSKRLNPSPQTIHSRNGTAQGVCVSCELRFTKGAYTKRERVCQLREKGTPALERRADVPLSLKATGLGRLSPLVIQHRIFSRIPEKVWLVAGDGIHWSVQAVIQRQPGGV